MMCGKKGRETMLDIYKRIRARREELGLSQEELAARMGYKSKSSINKIEMGINDIPQSKVLAFARALDTTTAYLMGCDDDGDFADTAQVSSTPILSDRAFRVGCMYDIATPRDKKFVDLTLEPYENQVQIPAQAIPIKKTPTPAQEIAYPKIKHRSDGFCEITVYEDQLPAAGPSSYFDEPRSHIEQYPQGSIPQGATFAVPIAGNSMEPKFKNGATVFVQSAPRVENGEVGLFSLNGEPYIKQLVVDEARHEVRLHSLNPAYQDIEIHEGDYLYTFGRVLGSYSV